MGSLTSCKLQYVNPDERSQSWLDPAVIYGAEKITCAKQRGFHPNVSKGYPVGGLKIKANLEQRFGRAAICIKCGAIWRQHMQVGSPD